MATTAITKQKGTVAKYKIKSTNNFITFLKRFSSIEKGLLLEIHEDGLIAKSHTVDRAVIKYSKINIQDVLEGITPVEMIKVGIFDINKVVNAFRHFADGDEIFLDIKYETVQGESICTEMLIHSASLKIKILGADATMFHYIAPDMIKRLVKAAADEKIVDFPFPKEAFSKVNNLCSMDTGKDFLHIRIQEGNIVVSGKSFDYTVASAQSGVSAEFTFYNEHFGLIDQEISAFNLGQNKLLVKSQESDTFIIIGRVE